MADYLKGQTYGGTAWTPEFVTDLDQNSCIGCGRCFKVCPRDVFDLVEKDTDDDDYDDDYGDFEDDDNSMVMSLKSPEDCIGCTSCAKVCPKDCFTHASKAL